MSLDNHTLNQLIEAIREEGDRFLATPEDANYFRNAKRKTENAKLEKEFKPVVKVEVVVKKEVTQKVEVTPPPKKETPKVEEEPVRLKVELSAVRQVLSVVAPELAILEEIPNDAVARKIAERWKTKNQTAPISVLSYQEPEAQKALLEGIAMAIDVYFGPAKLVNVEGIEKEKQWEAFLGVEGLKMVVVCDYTLWQLRGLMGHYKETPAQGARMVGNVPVFLLPDLSLYLKDPLLKRSLWKALCQKFS